jgi:hypothetical protein
MVDSESQAELQHQHSLHWQAMQNLQVCALSPGQQRPLLLLLSLALSSYANGMHAVCAVQATQPSGLGAMAMPPANCPPDLYQHLQRLHLSAFASPSAAVSMAAKCSPVDLSLQRSSSSPPPPMSLSGGLHIIKEDAGDAGDGMDYEHHQESIGVRNSNSGGGRGFVYPQISITDAQGHVTPVPGTIREEEEAISRPESPLQHDMGDSSTIGDRSNSAPIGIPNYMMSAYEQFHHDMYVTAGTEPVPSQYASNFTNAYMMAGTSYPSAMYGYNALHAMDSIPYYATPAAVPSPGTLPHVTRLSSANSIDSLDVLACLQPELQRDMSTVSFQSQRTMSDLLRQIRRTLEERRVLGADVSYEQPATTVGGSNDSAVFVLQNASVALELQVCAGTAERALRLKKLAGDVHQYCNLCTQVLSCVEL